MRCIADTAPRPPSGPVFADSEGDRPRLREFAPGDVDAIAEIVAEALHERYDASLYLSLGSQWPEGFLVAVDAADRPVGFLLGVCQVEREARILMFAVERGRRTRGVGSRLMRTFLDRCRARGLRRVTLEVRASNATAIRFYTHFGFSVLELLRGYYSDGENGYQMATELA